MTEHPTSPGFDPRFDPRFQRGYAADAAAPAPDPARMPDPTQRDARLDGAAPVAGFGDSADTPQASPATRGQAAETPNPATLGAGVAGATTPDVAAGHSAGALDGSHEDEGEVRGGPALEAESAPHASSARWFWIALGACAAFIVVGATLYWTQASDPSYFMGGRPGFTKTVQLFVVTLSPALVQAGVIGLAAVLVAWAVRGRGEPRGRQ